MGETIALFAQELCAFMQCRYIGCAIEYKVYPAFFKFTLVFKPLEQITY